MGNIRKLTSISLILALSFVAGLLITSKSDISAQELSQGNNDQQAQSSQSQVYSYTAQSGDSYSLLARKAIQTYGITNKVDLTEAQIIFTETNLTQIAGSPTLVQGQKAEIKESSVKEWADKAKGLSQEKQAAWDVYAKGANFNTNAVGQSS